MMILLQFDMDIVHERTNILNKICCIYYDSHVITLND